MRTLQRSLMEKPTRSKNGFSMVLPRAASDVTIKNPLFSPTREKRSDINAIKLKTHVGKGPSGPVVSMIPADSNNLSFRNQEPTSPEVSCVGQIKYNKKKTTANDQQKLISLPKDLKKKPSIIRNLFSCARPPVPISDFSCEKPPVNAKSDACAFANTYKTPLADRAPTLSQMKRFASGRDPTVGFDWNALQIAPADRGDYSGDESEGEAPEMMIPFSAPLLMRRELGGCGDGDGAIALEPRKEINLWKRRTMAQPRPLQITNLR